MRPMRGLNGELMLWPAESLAASDAFKFVVVMHIGRFRTQQTTVRPLFRADILIVMWMIYIVKRKAFE